MRDSADGVSWTRWVEQSRHRLAQFLKYTNNVYDLLGGLRGVRDRRIRPQIPTHHVLWSLCLAAVFRLPSFNALEGYLREAGFQRLLGRRASAGRKAFSADTVARVLDGLCAGSLRGANRAILTQAERNKAFREGGPAGLRCVAIDGWEMLSSRGRDCLDCLTRTLSTARGDVVEHYHRAAIALLLGPAVEVVLDFEFLRNQAGRRAAGELDVGTDEGEVTAARRVIRRLHEDFGRFLDVFVLDGLYPDGPTLHTLRQCGYSAVITLRKASDEPLKEALALTAGRPPDLTWDDPERRESLRAWDCPDLQTLDSYDGALRVVRVEVTSWDRGETKTWCALAVGEKVEKLSARQIHRIQRMRWHEENTGFHQWTTQWHLNHAFRHSPSGIPAVLWIWLLMFNLLQLFAYRRLRRRRSPADPSHTLRALVEQMRLGLGRVPRPLPWASRGS